MYVAPRNRSSWDDTWLRVAREVGTRSLCDRDQVGAVIVDPGNRIVATGYNGPPAGFDRTSRRLTGTTSDRSELSCVDWCPRAYAARWPECADAANVVEWARSDSHEPRSDYSDCPALHAEANALSVCDRSAREGGTVYVTSVVCFTCAKLLANSGLTRVVVGADVTKHVAHRRPARSYEFMRMCGLAVDIVAESNDVVEVERGT